MARARLSPVAVDAGSSRLQPSEFPEVAPPRSPHPRRQLVGVLIVQSRWHLPPASRQSVRMESPIDGAPRLGHLHRMALMVAAMSIGACSGDGGRDTVASEHASIHDVAQSLGCMDTQEISYFNAPIRGAAATEGISCETEDAVVHVFERAEVGDLDDSDEAYAFAQGGSDENVARLLGTGETGPPGCRSWVLVTEDWFVVSDNEDLLAALRDKSGDPARSVAPASPPASYVPPGCSLGGG